MDSIGAATLEFHPGYAAMVLLGLAVALFFPVTRDFTQPGDKQRYYVLQGITLVAAILGAKLAVLMGDALWPLRPFEQWPLLLTSGRSIVGALLVGFLVAETAKPLLRYPLPPNDRFAVILPFSVGLGRVGCYLAGCCLGLPHLSPLSLIYADGIARYPIAIYEMLFHFAMCLLLWLLYRRRILFGRLFALYLVIYGVFRFVTEEYRVTEKAFYGHSAYQGFAVAMIVAGTIAIIARSGDEPPRWARTRREVAQ